MFEQFTESDRAVLAQLLALQVPKKEIASRLSKDRSSMDLELARNSGPLGYVPIEAQQRAMARRRLPRPQERRRKNARLCITQLPASFVPFVPSVQSAGPHAERDHWSRLWPRECLTCIKLHNGRRR
ncbi:MAG TPA: hypothetical protein VFB80_19485 [Pirellulaceae bacterium]|nr:hypothetical protein [Pirellulaceae bacterium]